ncbi:MAG TPA: hypothetical protein VFO84_03755 [Dehalococcoidia bacterium]|nr:hypothetical protein [Dehalococcoidia bacterium]
MRYPSRLISLFNRRTLAEPAVKAVTWPGTARRAVRDAFAALGAGILIGAIGWELLEQKTRSYWS